MTKYITFPSRAEGRGVRSVPLVIAGEKTTQWRVIKPQPREGAEFVGCHGRVCKFDLGAGSGWYANAPYCPGEVCFVKETWSMDEAGAFVYYDDHDSHPAQGWKRALTMPPQAARIFVKISGVKAVRLHDLTAKDARKEGLDELNAQVWADYAPADEQAGGGHWAENPWVWVISFKKCAKPRDFEKQHWSEESVERSMEQSYQNRYEIRIRKTGEFVAAGTAQECAQQLGRTTHAIYDMVRKSRSEKYLYQVTRTHGSGRSGKRKKKEE